MFCVKSILLSSYIILLIVLHAVSCIERKKETALIFERFTGTLVRLLKPGSKTAFCGDWATACPVSAVGNSLIKNSLIVKEIYHSGGKMTDVKEKVCEDPYKISIAFDIVEMNFRFGFAIYYEFSKENYFRPSKLKHFMAPKTITEIIPNKKYLKKMKKDVKNDNQDYNDEILFNGKKMEFMWIQMFYLRFNFFKKILKKITYTILQSNKWPLGEHCVDYSLGSEVYEETNNNYVDNLYSEDNQSKIFQNIKIPVRECTNGTCPVKNSCEQKKSCLSKWLLIPKDQFTFGSSSSSACSNLATTPIWTDKVAKVLRKVDQYLFALHRITGETLLITSGVSTDILRLPNTDGWFRKTSAIYLDSTRKKIPVPKIIYKLVKFRYRSDPNLEINTAWYSALIVVHNNPYYEKGSQICSEDVTEKWGWQEITKDRDGSEFENVYVCRADGDELRKVMGCWSAAGQPPSGDLNLRKFPSPRIGNVGTANIESRVNDEFRSISQQRVSLSSDAEILERDEEIFSMSEDEVEDAEENEEEEVDNVDEDVDDEEYK